jgi:hypothetical protein
MAITIPVTVQQIQDELQEQINSVTVSTPVGGHLDDNNVMVIDYADKPDGSQVATNRAIAQTIYNTLKAILNSASINVDGVL